MKNKIPAMPPSEKQMKRYYSFVMVKSLFDIIFAFIITSLFPSVDNNLFRNIETMFADLSKGGTVSAFQSYGIVVMLGLLYLGVVIFKGVKIIIFILTMDFSTKYDLSETTFGSFLLNTGEKYVSNHKWMSVCWISYMLLLKFISLSEDSKDFIIRFAISVLCYWTVRSLLSTIFGSRSTEKYIGDVRVKKLEAQAAISQEESRKKTDEIDDEMYGKDPNKSKDPESSGGSDSKKESHQDDLKNIDSLLKYKKLLDMGAITPEEFEQKKKEMLK